MNNIILYSVTLIVLLISLLKDRHKTVMALKKAWKTFENILPQMLVVLVIIGFVLTLLNAGTVSMILGSESGWLGVLISAVAGAVTLIPGFVAFPLAAAVLEKGAGFMQIGAFVSTLMMVGIVTLPVEIKYLGKKIALIRNGLGFLFSFFVALIIGMVVG